MDEGQKPQVKEVANVDDKTIVALYWERSEAAIEHSQQKYGKYCYRIADNILHCKEDAEECVNDTWVRAWNAMPPERPTLLQAFLGKITRNLALDRYAYNHAKKRNSDLLEAFEELEPCLPGCSSDGEDALLREDFRKFINRSTVRHNRFIRQITVLQSNERHRIVIRRCLKYGDRVPRKYRRAYGEVIRSMRSIEGVKICRN